MPTNQTLPRLTRHGVDAKLDLHALVAQHLGQLWRGGEGEGQKVNDLRWALQAGG